MNNKTLNIICFSPFSGRFTGLSYSVPAMIEVLYRHSEVNLLFVNSSNNLSLNNKVPTLKKSDLVNSVTKFPKGFNKPDLLLFQSTYLPIHFKYANEAIKKNIPYVITPRGGMTEGAQKQKPLKKKIGNFAFFNKMVKNASAIHCLNAAEAKDVAKWTDCHFVVGNGVNLPSQVLINNTEVARFNITFIGRLDLNHKGLDLLISSCAHAREYLKNRGAVINLYGPSINNSKSILKNMVNDFGLKEIVNIHGPVYKEEKEKVLRQTNVFLHTSRFEGHPMAVLEAMSYGVPCLVTPGTNISEEVQNTNSGWSTSSSPNQIGEKLIEITKSSSKQIIEKGFNARRLIEEKYTWDIIGKELLKEYKKILNREGFN
ncbi:glycosyltransferase [Salsuginibacillus kocurii]|uniref:glycosyltransferase n=1 Tax=Salsuginibacillus kocurii TaxID=427078 RepID=UPI000367F996|nr:glycosyltransferase [Salsuginibacillus kocurii]